MRADQIATSRTELMTSLKSTLNTLEMSGMKRDKALTLLRETFKLSETECKELMNDRKNK